MIYMDNAATSLVKPAGVESAVIKAMRTAASPGRGSHAPAMLAAENVLSCRRAAARLFNVDDPERVVFTMNATHGLNIAIKSLAKKGTKAVVSGFEHNSAVRPLYALDARVKIAGRRLFAGEDTLSAFKRALPGAELAVCTYVSNAFGYILPIYDIAELCTRYKVPLIVDASQAAGVLPVDFSALKAQFVAMPGHKALYGPQGTGILLCTGEGTPLLTGGSGSDSRSSEMPQFLPDRLEAGTQNASGIAGLEKGIEYVLSVGTEAILAHERALVAEMAERVGSMKNIKAFFGDERQQSGVLSVLPENMSCEQLSQQLDSAGICARSGLHCSPLSHESAGTIDTGTLRFSFSPFLSKGDAVQVCEKLQEITAKDK